MKFKPEVIEIVKTRFAAFEIEMNEVKDRLTTIYDQPYMSQFQDETERQMASLKILMAQVIAQADKKAFSKSETILMRIEGKDEVTAFKRQDGTESYRSNLYVTAMYEDTPRFGQVTLWGDANEMNPSLTVEKTYLIPATVGGKDPLSMSVNDPVDADPVDEEMPPLVEVIKNDFSAIDIKDMGGNISRDWADVKLIKGTVLSSWMKVTKNNENMGFLKMVGDNAKDVTVIKFSKRADQVVMFGTGSMVLVLGQVTDSVLDEDGMEKYPVSAWGSLIIPTLIIPPEMKDLNGIETSETPIVKPDGETAGFTEDDISGW